MKGYYINLDSREDRKEHFEKNIKRWPLFKDVDRFSAIRAEKGYIGCGKSHIEVLKKLQNEDGEYFIVCEDDLQIINNNSFKNFMTNFTRISHVDAWDLITLTPFYPITSAGHRKIMFKHGFLKLDAAQTTTCYIIQKTFIKTLLDNFQCAVKGLCEGKAECDFAIDIQWKRLFKSYNIYGFRHIFASQLVGYSDIRLKNINYSQELGIKGSE